MAVIVKKRALNPSVSLMELSAPLIAQKARPGQFVILRADPQGERIPLTLSDFDPAAGTVTVLYQKVGLSTAKLDALEPGQEVLDLVGPLGNPTELSGVRRAVVVGGGVGCAIAYPQAKALHTSGAAVDLIGGFRSKDLVLLEPELRRASRALYLTTDDGSYGRHGFVTDVLSELLQGPEPYDLCLAVGPVPMMRAVSRLTEPLGLRTLVSLNPIMVDGTGMCGCCRVTVGGQVKFACVDGPDFDGHQVDYDELMVRNAAYRDQERRAKEDHVCRMEAQAQRLQKEALTHA